LLVALAFIFYYLASACQPSRSQPIQFCLAEIACLVSLLGQQYLFVSTCHCHPHFTSCSSLTDHLELSYTPSMMGINAAALSMDSASPGL
jgi:hypothetical protein